MKKRFLLVLVFFIFAIISFLFFVYADDIAYQQDVTSINDDVVSNVIVELKEKPLIEKRNELAKEVNDLKDKAEQYSNEVEEIDKEGVNGIDVLYEPIVKAYKNWRANSLSSKAEDKEKDIDSKIKDHEKKIKDEHQNFRKNLNKNQETSNKELKEYFKVFNGFLIETSNIEEIKNNPEVKKIYENLEVNLSLKDSVPLINADDVWNLVDNQGRNLDGNGTTIAILDTGVDYTHEDLGGCFGKTDSVQNKTCKVIGGYDVYNNDNNPIDDHGHGTHVAATAAGTGGTSGLRGVAPNAKIFAYKVLGSSGSGSFSDVIEGIERAVDPNQDGNFSDKVDVISMSLGANCGSYAPNICGPDDPVSKAVDMAANSGTVVVIAAGNSGPSEGTIGSPGTARKAITVGATDKNNLLASFSSRGFTSIGTLKPDVVAPGVNICAAQFDSWYDTKHCIDKKHISISGTSTATPHVAGLAALIKQKNPDWSPDQIKYAIRNSAVNLKFKYTEQGYGRVDALAAVNIQNSPPVGILNTSGKVFETIDITGKINLENFKGYKLEYGLGDSPSSWNLILNSNEYPQGNVLYSNFDTSLLKMGKNLLRLTVYGIDGQNSMDITMINLSNFEITEPKEKSWLNKPKNIEIKGTIGGASLDHYTIEWGYGETPTSFSSEGISLKNEGREIVINSTLGFFNTSQIKKSGFYILKITAYYLSRETIEIRKKIYIEFDQLEGWPVQVRENTFLSYTMSSPVIADLDKDGKKELVVISSYAFEGIVSVFNFRGELAPGWPKNIESYRSFASTPGIGNLDDDEELEIVVTSGYKVYVWNHDGSVVPGWPKTNTIQIISSPTISDIDNDKDYEIIFADFYTQSNINILNHDGSVVPGWPVRITDGGNLGDISVADLDNDDKMELVFRQSAFPKIFKYWALNHDGSVVPGWPISNATPYSKLGIALGDVDNDGEIEIVGNTYISGIDSKGYLFSMSNLTIFDIKGNVEITKRVSSYYATSSPALADLDNNGDLEIVEEAQYNHLRIFNHDGSSFWSEDKIMDGNFRSEGDNAHHSTPVIADINGDGNPDIIKTSGYAKINDNAKVYAWDANGNMLEGWPKAVAISREYIEVIHSTPAVDDIDNDGDVDVFVAGRDGKVYAWDLPYAYDESASEWKMFRHDLQHTCLYENETSRQNTKNFPILFSNNLVISNQDSILGKDLDLNEKVMNIASEKNNKITYSTIDSSGSVIRYGINLSDGSAQSTNPRIVSNSNGAYVVWEETKDGNKEIYFSKIYEGNIASTKRITFTNLDSVTPSILDEADGLGILWIENNSKKGLYYKKIGYDGGDIILDKQLSSDIANYDYYAYNNKVYLSLQDSSNQVFFSELVSGSINPRLAIRNSKETEIIKNKESSIIFVWVNYSDSILFSEFELNNLTLVNGKIIGTSAENIDVEIDNLGYIYVAWNSKDSKDIFYSVIDFSGEIIVNSNQITNSSTSHSPILGTNTNTVVVLFEENNGETKNIAFKTNSPLEKVSPKLTEEVLVKKSTYSATLKITSNEPTKLEVLFYESDSSQPVKNVSNNSLGYEHFISIEGLKPSKKYTYDTKLVDIAGNALKTTNSKGFWTRTTSNIPALPTSLYGLVKTTDDIPASNVEVVAKWTDVDNNVYYSTTKTLTKEEANAKNNVSLEGYFFFNEGQVMAKPGSKIEASVEADLNDPQPFVISSPGKPLQQINEPILLSGKLPEIMVYSPEVSKTYLSSELPIYLNYSVAKPLREAYYQLNSREQISILNLENQNINISLIPGTNVLSINIVDYVGLKNNKTIGFTVKDNVAPIVTLKKPEYSEGKVILKTEISDDISNLDMNCEVCISSDNSCDSANEWKDANEEYSPGSSFGICSYTIQTAGYNSGDYIFNFRIKDSSENLAQSKATKSFVIDNTSPEEVSGLSVKEVKGINALDLKWQDSSDESFMEYRIYRSSSPEILIKVISDKNQTSYRDINLESDGFYDYRITVVDKYFNENIGVNISGHVDDTTIPIVSIENPTPSSIYNHTNIKLLYTVNEQDCVCNYSLNGNISGIVSPLTTSLREGVNRLFVFCNDGVNTGYSQNISFTIDRIAPNPISVLSLKQKSSQLGVDVSWNSSSDPVSYILYRNNTYFTSVNGLIPLYAGNNQEYSDDNLEQGKAYYYSVVPVDVAGNANFNLTTVKSLTIKETVPPVVTVTSPAQNQVLNSESITLEYNVNEPISYCSYILNSQSAQNITSGNKITAKEGHNNIEVYCEDINGNIGYSGLRLFSVDIGAPEKIQGLTVQRVPGEVSLMLNWRVSNAPDLNLYKIYREENEFSSVEGLKEYATTNSLSYTDSNLQSGKTYYYAVTAVDFFGNEIKEVVSVGETAYDDTPIVITIDSPIQDKYYSNNKIELSYTINKPVVECNYSLNDPNANFSEYLPSENKTNGICFISDSFTGWFSLKPSDPDLGKGYAKRHIPESNNNLSLLKTLCTEDVFNDLMKEYCTINNKSVQWEVVVLGSSSTSPITRNNYSLHYCSELYENKSRGICLIRNGHQNVPDLADPDFAVGYAKKHMPGVETMDGLRQNCTEQIYWDLMREYCKSSNELIPFWEIAVLGYSQSCYSKDGCMNMYCEDLYNNFTDNRATCSVTAKFGALTNPYSPDLGHHYAKKHMPGVGLNRTLIKSLCTDDILESLMDSYCSINVMEVQWRYGIYGVTGGCATSGCQYHYCPCSVEGEIICECILPDTNNCNNWERYICKNGNWTKLDWCGEGLPPGPNSCSNGVCNGKDSNATSSIITGNAIIKSSSKKSLIGSIITILSGKAVTNQETETSETKSETITANEGPNLVYITCKDERNVIGKSNVVRFFVDTILPPKVSSLTVSQLNNSNSMSLSWQEYTDSDLLHYRIYRSQSQFSDVSSMSPIAYQTSNGFVDQGLQEGEYYYAVTAIDKALNENKNVDSVYGKITIRDETAPFVSVNNIGKQINGNVMLKASVSDNLGLKQSCAICISSDGICDDEWISAINKFNQSEKSGTCEYSWNTDLFTEGTYYYNFRVNDLSDNLGVGMQMNTIVNRSTIENETACSDGTLYNTCSLTKPLFCENGNLIKRCDTCSCPERTICDSSTLDCVFSQSPIKELVLYPGWNLFSLPVKLNDRSIANVLSDISNKYNIVYSYDSLLGKWLLFKPDQELFDQSNSLTTFEIGKAYWIEMKEQGILNLSGESLGSFSIALQPGWNLVSSPYSYESSVENAFSSLGDNYDIIFGFNASTQEWMYFSPYHYDLYENTLEKIEPGKGYWIYLYDNSIWQV